MNEGNFVTTFNSLFNEELDYNCGKCTGKKSLLYNLIDILPDILYVNFKKNNIGKKLQTKQVLSSFGVRGKNKKCNYKLHAIICHTGKSVNCGHYYVIIKRGNEWTKCNDNDIEEDHKLEEKDISDSRIVLYKI